MSRIALIPRLATPTTASKIKKMVRAMPKNLLALDPSIRSGFLQGHCCEGCLSASSMRGSKASSLPSLQGLGQHEPFRDSRVLTKIPLPQPSSSPWLIVASAVRATTNECLVDECCQDTELQSVWLPPLLMIPCSASDTYPRTKRITVSMHQSRDKQSYRQCLVSTRYRLRVSRELCSIPS
jgi:hypothetical protein